MWTKPKLFTHTLTWRGVLITIDHHLDFLVAGNSRLRVSVAWPVNAPTPITWGGPCTLDVDTEVLSLAGGAEAFVLQKLNTGAEQPAWRRQEARKRQSELDL